MRVLPMGFRAVLIDELDGEPAAVADAVRAQLGAAVLDVVPGAASVLVTVRRDDDLHAVLGRIGGLESAGPESNTAERFVEIPVAYDGPDLADLAASIGRPVDEVVALHCGATYHVDFCGFAPGFGYLSGLPEVLHVPRRSSPRTRVPAGSVAIASSYSAVYPTSSPGGWHLLGSTTTVLFDPDRDRPALLEPGTIVRFTQA